MKKAKLLALVCVLALAVSMLAGCGSTPDSTSGSATDSTSGTTTDSSSGSAEDNTSGSSEGDKGTIGILMPTLGAEFFTNTANSLAATVEAAGYSANIQSFDMDAAQAVTVIENFITDGVVGIAYMTIDASGDDALKEAMDKGIAVLTCGVENENYDICLITANDKTGYMVGQMAAEYIDANFGGSAEIAVVGSDGSQNMLERTEGIKAALAELSPNSTIVYEFNTSNVGEGTTFAENLNSMYPNCQIVVSYSDTFAAEIEEVFNALSYPDTAAIFGHDGEAKVLSSIAGGGYIKGTIVFGDSGVEMANGLLNYLNGVAGYESGALIEMEGIAVTPENISEFYAN